MKEFRFIGAHAETLDGGRPIEPGEFTGPIDHELLQNAHLIESGALIEVPNGTAKKLGRESSKTNNEEGDDR